MIIILYIGQNQGEKNHIYIGQNVQENVRGTKNQGKKNKRTKEKIKEIKKLSQAKSGR